MQLQYWYYFPVQLSLLCDQRPRGAFLVSATMKKGEVSKVEISSDKEGEIILENPFGNVEFLSAKEYFKVAQFIKLNLAEGEKAVFNRFKEGATALARDWKAPGKGGIYDRMTEDLKSAIKKLEKQGFKVSLRGFIWIQGESDAGNENTARDYYLNLNHLPIETPRLAAVIRMPAQLLGQESVVSAKVTSYDSIPLLNAEVKARGKGMSDIQNIRVKGSTASIYCYRGGNGVVEVDTKRGKFK